MKLNIDFETRSTVDLRKTGVYPYAQSPDTDIWCMAYAFGDEDVELVPFIDSADAAGHRDRINEYITAGGGVYAWNAQFERIIWNLILVPRYGYVALPRAQTFDTAAQAAALALPRGLGQCAVALGITEDKDVDGHKLMLRMARPRSKKGVRPLVWWNERDRMERLYDYCRQDVVVERTIGQMLPELTPTEQLVYELDQKANDRGVLIDVPLVRAAQRMAVVTKAEANEEISVITAGHVTSVSKVTDLRDWVNSRGVEMDTARKETIRDLLNTDIPQDVRDALQLRQDVGKTSAAKLTSMIACLCDDDRARGLLLYHGASTGRWSGKLIQPQNFPRPQIDAEAYIDRVMTEDYEAMQDPVMVVLSSLLRSMLRAADGHTFIAGDYSQIEARVLAWLADEAELTELFRSGGLVYETMGAFIFGKEVDEIGKDSFERQIGKNSVLGAGFQMGADRFAEQVHEQTGIVLDRGDADTGAPDIAKAAIDGYRALYPRIPAFWQGINNAAMGAVSAPGTVQHCGVRGSVRFTMRGDILWCILPSGRKLAYFSPELRMRALPAPWQDVEKMALSFVGVDSLTRKWKRQHTYGGHLTENVVQAIARDIMAEAMLALDAAGYPVILTVHDEVITEPQSGHGDVTAFVDIMTTLPVWAEGLPVTAEAWQGQRYRK